MNITLKDFHSLLLNRVMNLSLFLDTPPPPKTIIENINDVVECLYELIKHLDSLENEPKD